MIADPEYLVQGGDITNGDGTGEAMISIPLMGFERTN